MAVVWSVSGDLFGPHSVVPWWAWAATLLMIFIGFVAPSGRDDTPGLPGSGERGQGPSR